MLYQNNTKEILYAIDDYIMGEDYHQDSSYRCSICGSEKLDTLYMDESGQCVGCGDCIKITNSEIEESCPICGEVAPDKLFVDENNNYIGCSECISCVQHPLAACARGELFANAW